MQEYGAIVEKEPETDLAKKSFVNTQDTKSFWGLIGLRDFEIPGFAFASSNGSNLLIAEYRDLKIPTSQNPAIPQTILS